MKTKNVITALGAGFLLSIPSLSSAQSVREKSNAEDLRTEVREQSIGLQGGYANTDDTALDDSAAFGVEAGYQWSDLVSFGIEFGGYESDGDTADLTRTKLLGKAYAHFRGDNRLAQNSYIGIAAGPVWDEVRGNTDTEAGVAPIVGFDMPIEGEAFTVGANANYLVVGGSNPDVFTLNGALKYWY
jgi:hypothetical protein